MGALKREASSELPDAPGQRRHSPFTPTECLAVHRPAAKPLQATAGEVLGSSLESSETLRDAAGHPQTGGAAISNPQLGDTVVGREEAPAWADPKQTLGEPGEQQLPVLASAVDDRMDCAVANGEAEGTGQGDGVPASNGNGAEDGMGNGEAHGEGASVSPTEGIVAQRLPPELAR
jgi:hypothetical protein